MEINADTNMCAWVRAGDWSGLADTDPVIVIPFNPQQNCNIKTILLVDFIVSIFLLILYVVMRKLIYRLRHFFQRRVRRQIEYEPKRDLLTLVSNATHSTYRYTYDAAGRRTFENDEDYGSYENLEADGTGVGCNRAGANYECCCKENFTP